MLGLPEYLESLPPGILTARDRVVAAVLYSRANDKTGICWPSKPSIALAADCDVRAVGRCIQALVSAGLWEVLTVGRGRTSSRYRVVRERANTPPLRGHLNPPNSNESSSRRAATDAPATSAPATSQAPMGHYSRSQILAAEYNRLGAEAGMENFDILTATARAKDAEDAALAADAQAHPGENEPLPF